MKTFLLLLALLAPAQPAQRVPKYSFDEKVFVKDEFGIFPGVIDGNGRWDSVYKQYFYPVIFCDGKIWYRFREPESNIGKTIKELQVERKTPNAKCN